MKWWGWGSIEKKFDDTNRPSFKPWLYQMAGTKELKLKYPVAEQEIKLSEPVTNDTFINQILLKINKNQIVQNSTQRILHTYGKSYADLLRIRKGIIKSAPDMVIFPKNHDEVVFIMKAAYENDVVVIPFGGGTNIVGCVEVTDGTPRMKVSMDMQLMNQVLSIDSYSQTAVIQAGILGTKLDEDLKKMGFTLGHHPDSFEFSTLGGWIATRSAGMQSNQYGRIEDMVLALKVVTPIGEVITKNVPASAAGPNLNALLIGSEGTLGIITEATMKIHPAPEIEEYYAYLFKNFKQGVAVIYECHLKGFVPSVIRLQDSHETALV
jgi:alkyldihydroxyacetonephosphate synthase